MIPLLTDAQLSETPSSVVNDIRVRRGGSLLNLDRLLLHSPSLAAGWNAFFGTLRSEKALSVPTVLRELCIMYIAKLNGAPYEWQQHKPFFIAAASGGTKTEQQLCWLEKQQQQHPDEKPCFDESPFDASEALALQLTWESTRNVAIRDTTMDLALAHFTQTQLVELLVVISGYNCVSRVLVASRLPLESEKKKE
jgi:alkylhydroperoxidase family enzyme